jgi:HlyD family secretion protein
MLTGSIKKYLIVFSLILSILGCENNRNKSFPGYIEGEYTYVASSVSGALVELNVKRGEQVKKGDPLYLLEPQPEEGALNAAKARVAELEVQLALSAVQFERQVELYQTHATSKVAYDIAEAAYHARQNQYHEAKAQVAQAEWAWEQKKMVSPVTGLVFDTFFRVGEKVGAHQPVVAILAPENIRVLFYIPEPKLSQIKIGQAIYFTCDGCKEKTKATISYISPEAEYTPPVIYSKDTRDKLVYLVRADMPATVAQNFHPGQPVDIFLHE